MTLYSSAENAGKLISTGNLLKISQYRSQRDLSNGGSICALFCRMFELQAAKVEEVGTTLVEVLLTATVWTTPRPAPAPWGSGCGPACWTFGTNWWNSVPSDASESCAHYGYGLSGLCIWKRGVWIIILYGCDSYNLYVVWYYREFFFHCILILGSLISLLC